MPLTRVVCLLSLWTGAAHATSHETPESRHVVVLPLAGPGISPMYNEHYELAANRFNGTLGLNAVTRVTDKHNSTSCHGDEGCEIVNSLLPAGVGVR